MSTETFAPTHEIRTNGRVIPVMACNGDDGGQVLYTREEWESDSQADWETAANGVLFFQGTHPGLGAELVQLPPAGFRVYQGRDAQMASIHEAGSWYYEPTDWADGTVFSEPFPTREQAVEAAHEYVTEQAISA